MPEIRANNVPEELLLRFDVERAKRGRMSIKDAVIEAIQLWLEAAEQQARGSEAAERPDPRLVPLTSEERELVEALLHRLRAGHTEREAFVSNLRSLLGLEAPSSSKLKQTKAR
jgi:hypothetical protein